MACSRHLGPDFLSQYDFDDVDMCTDFVLPTSGSMPLFSQHRSAARMVHQRIDVRFLTLFFAKFSLGFRSQKVKNCPPQRTKPIDAWPNQSAGKRIPLISPTVQKDTGSVTRTPNMS